MRINEHRPRTRSTICILGTAHHLKEAAIFDKNRSAVTPVVFSSDEKWLAAGESSGKVLIVSDEGSGLQVGRWPTLETIFFLPHFSAQTCYVPTSPPIPYSAHIYALQFRSSNEWPASGSLDTHVHVWNVVNPGQKKAIQIPNAGVGGVNVFEWVGGTAVLSAGSDASLRP